MPGNWLRCKKLKCPLHRMLGDRLRQLGQEEKTLLPVLVRSAVSCVPIHAAQLRSLGKNKELFVLTVHKLDTA